MGPLVDPFLDNEFMLRALVAGCLVAVGAAVVGTFVVLRGLAFIGDALAHGVLPGIAGAVILGLPGIGGALVGAAVMIAGVDLVRRRSRLSGDTAIGLLFVGMLALGVVIVSRSDSFTGDLTRILFGEVLGIAWSDIALQLAATVLVIVVAVVCARPFLMLAFDPEGTRVAGFRAGLYEWLMLGLVAVTVVVSFQTVGTLLVFGMLVAPPATAALVARRVGAMMAGAAAIGVVSVAAGLLLSYHYDLAGGATIVLVEVAGFFLALTAQALWRPAPPSLPGVTGAAALSTRGLAVGYDGRPVVSGIDLVLPRQGTLVVLGTNGSGKSTLVRTLVGLLPPVAGAAEVLGGPPGSRPRRVAYLGQVRAAGFALPIRARDVVTMGRFAERGLLGRITRADRALVDACMRRMGIAHLADAPVAELSGGQRQRVHIAQALAWAADLIVLDEPTSGLDVAGRELLLAALAEERARGAAVVMCTHDIRDAAAADVALLLAGRVVAQGRPAEVLTRDALMETFGLVLGELPGGGELVMDPVHRHDHDHGP